MKNLEKDIIELLKKDKNFLRTMKISAVDAGNYKLAAELREIERKHFPLSEEDKKSIEEVEQFVSMVRMLEIKVAKPFAYIFIEAMKFSNKGEFSLKDAAKIIDKTKELFGEY